MKRIHVLTIALLLSLPTSAHAGAWMRDAGSFYINLNYSHLGGNGFYGANFDRVNFNKGKYIQHSLGFYGEVGIVSRWLTATLDGQLYRRSTLTEKGRTEGFGDLRLGLWTGALVSPVRLSFGILLGMPTGDSTPSAGGNDPLADFNAKSLPTGDGEWDIEFRAALGYSFGGWKYWPLKHFLQVEAGYWLRTKGFNDAFTYKVEVGIQFPWTFIDRFWFILRLHGVENFASKSELQNGFSGLGDGVTYTSFGLEVSIRLYKGLAIGYGFDTAFRARLVISSLHHKVSISYNF